MLTFVGCVYLGIILLFASLLQLMVRPKLSAVGDW